MSNSQGDSVNREAAQRAEAARTAREMADMNASNARVAAGRGTAQDHGRTPGGN